MKNMCRNHLIRSRFPAVAVAVFAVAQVASAQTTQLWTAVPGTSADTNWSDNANWNSGTGTATNNNDVFGLIGTNKTLYVVNNVCDQNGINPNSLTYTNSNPGVFTTLIPAGVAATVATTLNVGNNITPSGSTCAVVIEGAGGLGVNGTVSINGAAASSTSQVNLDMSQLGSFTNNASTATLSVGTNTEINANLSLASNSIINVATIDVETTAGNNGRIGNIFLGASTNTIWANNINLGTGKAQTATMTFTNTTGTVAIAGTGGTGRANIVLGDDNSGSAAGSGFLTLSNHFANILAGTITIGGNGGSDTGQNDAGSVTFSEGVFDVTTILMGNSASSKDTNASSGTFTAGGSSTPNAATLVVNSPSGPGTGSLILGDANTSTDTGTGTLTIYANCTAEIYCSITKANAAEDTAILNLSGGTLIMEAVANTIGTAAAPVNTLNLKGGVLALSVSATATTTNVNASSVPITGTTALVITNLTGTIPAFPATVIPLITYSGSSPMSGLSLTVNPAISLNGTTPSLSDDGAGHISLVFTPSGPPPTIVIWTGATNGDWDDTTTNWAADGVPTNYVDGDVVQFDDTLLSNNIITLTTTLNPTNGVTVTNNNENYTFIGAGNIAIGTLSKQGSQALIIDNSGANTFNSTTIGGGALQIGNNDANGSLGSGSVHDDGSVVLDRNDGALNLSGTIDGSGSVIDNGSGGSVVTLSANNNSFSGGLVLNGGTVLAAQNGSVSTSSGTINFNGGTLEYGIQGVVGMTNTADYSSRFSTAANQQYNINLPAYPANDNTSPYASHIVTFASALTSSGGTLTKSGYGELELTGTNTFNGGIFVSGGVIRANNTNAYGANSITETAPGAEIYFNNGPWTYPNNLSIQGFGALEADDVTTFGAIRLGAANINLSGTITLTGDAGISARGAGSTGSTISGQITGPHGILFGRNSLTTSPSSSVIFLSNTLNNWTGDTTIADGTLKLGASGVIPNGSGFGNLILTNAGIGYNPAMTNSVFDLNGHDQTINGLSHAMGMTGATLNMLWVTNSGLAPTTLTLGNGNADGNFGGIIGNGTFQLSINKIGSGIQVLSGVNTYFGNTTVSTGTLALSGSGSIANSFSIAVAGGATFDVSALASTFTLGSGQTLSNVTAGASIDGTNNTDSGTITLYYDGVNPSFIMTNGGMTLSSSTLLNIFNTSGAPLAAGTYTLITNANAGIVAGTVPSSFTVSGAGIAPGTTNSLFITNGVLDLAITPLASPAIFTGISISGTTLTISATNGAADGQFVLLGTTNLLLPLNQWTPILTNSFDGSGNLNLSTNVLDPNTPVQFYLLQMP